MMKMPKDGRFGRRIRNWDKEGARLKAEAEQKETARVLAAATEKNAVENAGGRRALITAYRAKHPERETETNETIFQLATKELTSNKAVTTVTRGRTAICDAYRKAHPECKDESNAVVYKRAMAQVNAAKA